MVVGNRDSRSAGNGPAVAAAVECVFLEKAAVVTQISVASIHEPRRCRHLRPEEIVAIAERAVREFPISSMHDRRAAKEATQRQKSA